jgi:hypothetical protein
VSCHLGHGRCKRPADIAAGDVVVFMGTPHLIAEVEPYTHPTIGETQGIARAADGWGITLLEPTCVEVA